jgi:hypothetical protein
MSIIEIKYNTKHGIKNMSLESYISESFENGLQYNEAAQLCLRLFCSLDKVPVKYHTACDKSNLSTIFASLSMKGLIIKDDSSAVLYNAHSYSVKDINHWLSVIDSMFTIGDTVDIVIGSKLVSQLGAKS